MKPKILILINVVLINIMSNNRDHKGETYKHTIYCGQLYQYHRFQPIYVTKPNKQRDIRQLKDNRSPSDGEKVGRMLQQTRATIVTCKRPSPTYSIPLHLPPRFPFLSAIQLSGPETKNLNRHEGEMPTVSAQPHHSIAAHHLTYILNTCTPPFPNLR